MAPARSGADPGAASEATRRRSMPSSRSGWRCSGYEVHADGPDQVTRFIRRDLARWRQVVERRRSRSIRGPVRRPGTAPARMRDTVARCPPPPPPAPCLFLAAPPDAALPLRASRAPDRAGFRLGLPRIAPGTVGTLWAWVAFLVMQRWLSMPTIGWVILASLPIGWWACTVTARHMNIADPGSIVWDEVVAFWLVLWLVTPAGLLAQTLAFALFRFFDAAKPGPVAWADQLFKQRDAVPSTVRWGARASAFLRRPGGGLLHAAGDCRLARMVNTMNEQTHRAGRAAGRPAAAKGLDARDRRKLHRRADRGACTELSGSSLWFERGFVIYSNAAKTELLGVDAALIEAEGAVSEPVARAMAEGAVARSRAQVAVSVTGVAGPTGGTAGGEAGRHRRVVRLVGGRQLRTEAPPLRRRPQRGARRDGAARAADAGGLLRGSATMPAHEQPRPSSASTGPSPARCRHHGNLLRARRGVRRRSPSLRGRREVAGMWRMLCRPRGQGRDVWRLTWRDVKTDDHHRQRPLGRALPLQRHRPHRRQQHRRALHLHARRA